MGRGQAGRGARPRLLTESGQSPSPKWVPTWLQPPEHWWALDSAELSPCLRGARHSRHRNRGVVPAGGRPPFLQLFPRRTHKPTTHAAQGGRVPAPEATAPGNCLCQPAGPRARTQPGHALGWAHLPPQPLPAQAGILSCSPQTCTRVPILPALSWRCHHHLRGPGAEGRKSEGCPLPGSTLCLPHPPGGDPKVKGSPAP